MVNKDRTLEVLIATTVSLCCLDVLTAKWNLMQPAAVIGQVVSALLVLIAYIVRDKTNGHDNGNS